MTLKELCSIHGPSGSEWRIKKILLNYIQKNCSTWAVKPVVLSEGIKDNLILVFGKPRTVIFCHYDTTGFTVRYNNRIIPIGSPAYDENTILRSVTAEHSGKTYRIRKEEEQDYSLISKTITEAGTTLSFDCKFIENKTRFTGPYIDNRAGVWVSLKLAETLRNGMIVFTAYEEHGGGSVEFLAPYIYNKYHIQQALICDMTWESECVKQGKGMVVSLRDKYIPRETYLRQITGILNKNNVLFQKEVEGSGASDGGYLQKSAVPFDWCFCGAAVTGMHSSAESVHLKDLESLQKALLILMENLK